MDRSRTLAGLLIAAALPLLGAAADRLAYPIREARWSTSEALPQALTRQPRECLAGAAGDEARSVAIGRAAFRTPLLLGGQAARAGLSCASCHRNGRGNPDFVFPGLSGAPGTADVTSFLTSPRRGDHRDDPRRIPDLAADPPSIARDPAARALEAFIRGLVVEEFDGPEPPPAVLEGLADYVRALRPCGGEEPVRLVTHLGELDAALSAAVDAAERGDAATARLLIGAARSALGRIHERYRLPGLDAERRLSEQAGEALGRIRDRDALAIELVGWRSDWRPSLDRLQASEARSLYEPANFLLLSSL